MNTPRETEEVLKLVAAAERARARGTTDDDATKVAAAKKIAEQIQGAIQRAHLDNGGPLTTELCLRAVAIALGMMTRINYANEPPLSQITLIADLCQLVFQTSLEGQ